MGGGYKQQKTNSNEVRISGVVHGTRVGEIDDFGGEVRVVLMVLDGFWGGVGVFGRVEEERCVCVYDDIVCV